MKTYFFLRYNLFFWLQVFILFTPGKSENTIVNITDSLKLAYKSAVSDSAKRDALFEYAIHLSKIKHPDAYKEITEYKNFVSEKYKDYYPQSDYLYLMYYSRNSQSDSINKYLQSFQQLIDATKSNSLKYKLLLLISEYYETKGEFKNAHRYYLLYNDFSDSIYNNEKKMLQKSLDAQFELDNKDKTIALLKNKNAIGNAEIIASEKKSRNRTIIIIVLFVAILLLAFMLYSLYTSYKFKKEKNKLLQGIFVQTEKKSAELNLNLQEAQEFQNNITNNNKAKFEQSNFDSFIVNFPKENVSGDFVWSTRVGEEDILVVSDCTGHGVPGAFMSMIGVSLLNDAIHEKRIINPLNILHQVQLGLENLYRASDLAETDGMEMAVIVISSNTIQLATAGIDVYCINKSNELSIISGGFVGLGSMASNNMKTLSLHTFSLEELNAIYAASDGFTDQNKKNEKTKFSKKQFKELLLKIAPLSSEEQRAAIVNSFNMWKGEAPQKDDVTAVGIIL